MKTASPAFALTNLGPLAQLRAGRLTERVLRLLLGLWLYGLAIALMVEGGLGASPWDAFHVGLARHLPLSLGGVMIVTAAGVLLAWIPLRQRPGLGTLANALLLGPFADLALALLATPQSLPLRATYMLGGVLVCALATALYIGAQLGPGPRDGLMTGLARRTGASIRRVRTGIEISVLTIGVLMGGAVGVGTVLFAFGVGPLTQFFLRFLVVPVVAADAPAVAASAPASPRPAPYPTEGVSMSPEILRYSAFTTDPQGGNPAGVVLDARALSEAGMQRIAADVGYSETAFLSPRADAALDVRYFSPVGEVSFCGHATIAAMVAHAQRHGPGARLLHTRAGAVRVEVDGSLRATLTSVAPRVAPLHDARLDALLAALGWKAGELDPALPPAVAYAGAWHPVIAAATHERLARLDYDFDALGALMARHEWLTVNLVWRADATTFHARNPFPPGGVVEDPATGAAAAALGAFLDARRALPAGRAFVVRQGHHIGRQSQLHVRVPEDVREGVQVSGEAVPLELGAEARTQAA